MKNDPSNEEVLEFIKSKNLNAEKTRKFWFTKSRYFRSRVIDTEQEGWLWVKVIAGHLGVYSCLIETDIGYVIALSDVNGYIRTPEVLEGKFVRKILGSNVSLIARA